MTQTQKRELRKRGGHCKRGEVQSSIIEFILKNNGSVREPDIREYLLKKHNIKDQGGINKKLHELKTDSCIELIAPKKLSKVTQRHGLTNHWDINTFENLKSIKSRFNDKINLSEYDKCLDLILKQSSRSFLPTECDRLRTLLAQSPSFFDACVDTGLEILHARAIQSYRYGEGLDKYQHVKTDVSEFLVLYLKGHSNVEISEEEFLKLPLKRFTEILAEIFEELPDSVRQDVIPKLTNIISFIEEERSLSLRFIAKHYVRMDILSGVLSPEDLSPEELTVVFGEKKIEERNILTSLSTILADLSLDFDKFNNYPGNYSPELITRILELNTVQLKEFVAASEFETEIIDKCNELDSLNILWEQESKKQVRKLKSMKQETEKIQRKIETHDQLQEQEIKTMERKLKLIDQESERIKREIETLDMSYQKKIHQIRKELCDSLIKRLRH